MLRGFNLTSGQTVVLDLDSYIGNKVIQVNTFAGSLSVDISCDGINFFARSCYFSNWHVPSYITM